MKNWNKIADKEFKTMDADEQAQWEDLRKIVAKQ